MAEITHLIREGEGITDCCKKTPFELPYDDKIVVAGKKQHQVDCPKYGWKNAKKAE